MHHPNKTAHAVIESPEFKRLVSKRWSVSLLLTITILVIYIGFLLVVAFDKELLATKIGSYLPLALPIGFGIIVTAWLLTGIYVFWANNTYDTEVQEIKNKINAN
ncbi:DUF485 domain-containing protein [Adhaeribacter radiodurans]|uniref:DUF485 domain-containing protein n=1 Tax=Adhaeribacter radiodurans TaxID=2745197 RepID=A0A7L7L6H2_9BACT|nr:DUF485 domain-containing protein [Adhaeribacter radiodurans]QMU28105.1 DUF485 domain-containing protein [Adhaeribacter radiodurans]